jgi:hypothetical protein
VLGFWTGKDSAGTAGDLVDGRLWGWEGLEASAGRVVEIRYWG